MRVVLVNGRFLMQRVTGVQRYGRELLAALAREAAGRYRLVAAVPRAGGVDPVAGVELLDDRSWLPTSLWQQVRLPLIARRLGAWAVLSPANIGPVLARNHVVVLHDASPFAHAEWFTRSFGLYYRAMFRLLGRTARRVVTVSEFSRLSLAAAGVAGEGRITVIHQGISERFAPVAGTRFDAPYVLTVGSRDPRKNVRLLIAAWRGMGEGEKRGHILLVAGGGAGAFAEEGVGDAPPDVRFLGYVPDDKLPGLYAGAAVFVYCSLYEGFGLPPLEAMACGAPTVVARAGGLPEACGEAALYVDPLDPADIGRGIARVIGDAGLREDLAARGRLRSAGFPWAEAARKMIAILDGMEAAEG
jgi:glycosyltransferase involved in cell wall biosynthesis